MKNIVVVDASVALKWVIEEEDSDKALALLEEWDKAGITMIAPPLLAYEVTNILYQNVRKGEISRAKAKQALKEIMVSELEFDMPQNVELNLQALEFAFDFSLRATYDPHYLALAEREDCDLWTADARLWRAVQKKYPRVRLLADYQPPTS